MKHRAVLIGLAAVVALVLLNLWRGGALTGAQLALAALVGLVVGALAYRLLRVRRGAADGRRDA